MPSVEEISEMLADLGREVTIESDTPTKTTTVHLARMLIAATGYHLPNMSHGGTRPSYDAGSRRGLCGVRGRSAG